MLYTLDPRLQVPKGMILPVGPKRKRTNKREEPQTLFAGESAESIIRMVKAARQEGGEDKPEDNNGPEREYQPPDIEDPWDMSGARYFRVTEKCDEVQAGFQRLALSEAPGTTRPGEDAGRVEPRVDDPALPAPSGGATREGGVGGLRETAASTAPGNTRPDEDVGRVGPRQLDAATSQAPMEEEPDWSCDNQSEDGCLLPHAPTELCKSPRAAAQPKEEKPQRREKSPKNGLSATKVTSGPEAEKIKIGPTMHNLSTTVSTRALPRPSSP